MTSTSPRPAPGRTAGPTSSGPDPRFVAGAIALVLGIVTGVVSVYSDSRAGCAFWVAVALVLTLAAGMLLASGRPRVRTT